MPAPRDYIVLLAELHRMPERDDRRSAWRQSMATLASMVSSQRPAPLEGIAAEPLRASIEVALRDRLVDDLEFLSPPAAAAAVYELAAALPHGAERRELGRFVLQWLHDGTAATFVGLATLLALSSSKALAGPAIRARVALCLDLPIGAGTHADGLALGLICRDDVAHDWLTVPSTGSLPSRRLSARLLERAAREAARRASQGDDSGIRAFQGRLVRDAWQRLLTDRESLVWRHIATARGLLSDAVPIFAEEIRRNVDPSMTPTEWRRAAASLAARIALQPTEALAQARELLAGPVLDKDRGLAGAMVFGVPRAAESEPEAAETLLNELVAGGTLDAADALVDVRRERIHPGFGDAAAAAARVRIRAMLESGRVRDDGQVSLIHALDAELGGDGDPTSSALRDKVTSALITYAERGARAAAEDAARVLEAADGALGMLELSRDHDSAGRRHAFRALREIDRALLESSTLAHLLVLGARDEEAAQAVQPFDALFDRLNEWLVAREILPIRDASEIEHVTLRVSRLRTLLHLVDAEGSYVPTHDALRERRLRTTRILLRRAREDAPSALRRLVCAAAARACDAVAREGDAELSDVLLSIALHVRATDDLTTVSEAAMVPEIETAVRAFARLQRIVDEQPRSGHGIRARIDGLRFFIREIPASRSPRVEALRGCLLRFVGGLEQIAASAALTHLLAGTEGTMFAGLEDSAQELALLVVGAQRRMGERVERQTAECGPAIRAVDFAVERTLRGTPEALDGALMAAQAALLTELPPVLAEVAIATLDRIRRLPADADVPMRSSFVPVLSAKDAHLPAWLPPSRILGGFHIQRPLGAGTSGSVFVACRAEERHNARAELFALKVPAYDGTAARTLSEEQFLQLFRQEAGALLTLPEHPNLARFVTFDAGARPKPILVMELVEGPTLERVLEMGDLDGLQAIDLVGRIAAGIEAMHAAGVGHLDVKPTNVILRDPDGVLGPAPAAPVLVDFGLAGRNVRPGCGTGEYGAPEIWGLVPAGYTPDPARADVYSFGCLAYEVLTRRTLFEGSTEAGLITAHCSHDGFPPGVEELAAYPRTRPLATLLAGALRRDPRDRTTVAALRGELLALRPQLGALHWPLRP